MANYLKANQIDVSRYGLASVQGDGGIDSVSAKVREWFQERMTMQQGKETGGDREKKEEEKEKEKEVKVAKEVTGGTRVALLGELTVGIACPPQPPLPAPAATLLSALVRLLLQSGCTVVLPENAALLQSAAFLDELMEAQSVQPSLLFGQRVAELEEGAAGGGEGEEGPSKSGGVCHVMVCPTEDWMEMVTGLAAAGCHCTVGFSRHPARVRHPTLPLITLFLFG